MLQKPRNFPPAQSIRSKIPGAAIPADAMGPPAPAYASPRFDRRRFLGGAALAGLAAAAGGGAGCADAAEAAGPHHDPVAQDHAAVLNVRTFGARGDGKADDTASVQKALDVAGKQGGNTVFLPPGHYLLRGSLQVPECATLQGVFHAPQSGAGPVSGGAPPYQPRNGGSVLWAVGGKGQAEGTPLIALNRSSGVYGLSIFYPEQDPSHLVEYPWTIRQMAQDISVQNVLLVNPWQGVDCGTVLGNRHYIRGLWGQPLKTGLFIDACFDIGRVESLHFWPFWRTDRRVVDFMFRHGEAFRIGRTDWEYMLNTFCIGYRIGYHFIQTRHGAANGNFLGLGADASWNACVVEAAQGPGLLITNGEFVSFDAPKLGPEVDPVQVLVTKANAGPVRFVNCAFWGPSHSVARLEGDCTVGFSDCTFCYWMPPFAAIDARAGSLIVSGCEFQQPHRQITLGPAVKRAMISGNLARENWRIANHAHGAVKIALNVA